MAIQFKIQYGSAIKTCDTSATIKCNDKMMNENIIISCEEVCETIPTMSVSISDNILTITDNSEMMTLFDILVDDEVAQTVNIDTKLISFTIAGTTYQAEEDMNWTEWVASGYNTGGFHIRSDSRFIYNSDNDYIDDAVITDLIRHGIAYNIYINHGGGSN